MYQVNDDLSIYVTRGDIVSLDVKAMQGGSTFVFPAGSAIRIKVFEKKNCENVVLQKDFAVDADSESVPIDLTEHDTRIGGIISKPVDYWYEVELNPFTDPQTIIGYDEDGPKVFRLFPEGRDLTDDIQLEDIPIVDAELDLTSQRPIQNQAVARKFTTVEEEAEDHYQNKKNPHTVTADQLNALKRSGGTMTGDINMSTHQILGLPEAKSDGDALPLGQAKELFPNFEDFEGKSDAIQRVSGTLIAVKNSAHTPLKGLNVYGKTEQLTTTGKQLLKNCLIGQTKEGNGITFKANADGSVTINGTSTAECYWIIDDKTPINYQGKSLISSLEGAVDGVGIVIGYYKSDGTVVNSIAQISKEPNTFEYPADATTTRTFVYVSVGKTIKNVTIYPMIRLASNADDTYESYSEGKVSPTLEYGQELVSVENPTVMLRGKNLIPNLNEHSQYGITVTQNSDGTVTLNGTATTSHGLRGKGVYIPAGRYTLKCNNVLGANTWLSISNGELMVFPGEQQKTCDLESGEHWLYFYINQGVKFDNLVLEAQLESGETATNLEHYNEQNVAVHRVLSAIPVKEENHATYTDENGQMWLSDEIDFEKGVYIQRVNKKTLTAEDISHVSTAYFEYGTYVFTTIKDALNTSSDVVVISDKMFGISADHRTGSGYDDKYRCYAQSGVVYLRFPAGTGQKTLEECKAAFTGVTLQYALAEPIETPLSYNEMAAYEALRTYDPNTTVYNDAKAYMAVDYFTPTTPMQVNHGERNAGKILGIDEQGNAVPQDGSEKFAPAGYGLGGLSVYASDPNNVTSNGFYYCDENSYGIKDDFKESVFIHMNRSETEMVQIFVNTLGDFGVRRYLAGAWGEIKTATLSGSGAVG